MTISHSKAMHPADIEKALETLTILVDTREHPGEKLSDRMKQTGRPFERCKLDYGDYSAKITVDDDAVSLTGHVAVERKMDCNELAMCFGKERARFEREFERAHKAGAKIYLLIENENYEKIYAGNYGSGASFRSKFPPASMIGSLFAWQARYNVSVILCKEELTGKIIKDILYYEAREYLQND